jgi:hypothetical protein
MADIEHCECFACHGTGRFEAGADEDRPALTCAECDGEGQYEVVRADAYRGAVEERDRLQGYIQRVLAEDLHAHAGSRAWSRLREALYLTGGGRA